MAPGRARREQLEDLKDFCPNNGSNQGQNLALTVLHVPSPFDSPGVVRSPHSGVREDILAGSERLFITLSVGTLL